ncbi:hypothetical protein M9H77_06338 [Catharanthus roseus]|uniref:Uncharacterized protein n=1 Tax=Catharanthus roseus TaxID=4058 RepID=A0ACC0BS87_CATRO|nr:hypothetical protein M9H77_06338 [Catharanthus roseus]
MTKIALLQAVDSPSPASCAAHHDWPSTHSPAVSIPFDSEAQRAQPSTHGPADSLPGNSTAQRLHPSDRTSISVLPTQDRTTGPVVDPSNPGSFLDQNISTAPHPVAPNPVTFIQLLLLLLQASPQKYLVQGKVLELKRFLLDSRILIVMLYGRLLYHIPLLLPHPLRTSQNSDFCNPCPSEIACPVSYPVPVSCLEDKMLNSKKILAKVLTQDRMKIRLTSLPVPETQIGDLTMYILSRGLLSPNFRKPSLWKIFEHTIPAWTRNVPDPPGSDWEGGVKPKLKDGISKYGLSNGSTGCEAPTCPCTCPRPPNPSPLSTSYPGSACLCLPGKGRTGGRPSRAPRPGNLGAPFFTP